MKVQYFKNVLVSESNRSHGVYTIRTSILSKKVLAELFNNDFPSNTTHCFIRDDNKSITIWYYNVNGEFCKCIINI